MKNQNNRITKLKKQYFKHKPILCHERPLATTIAYMENENNPTIIKKAKAFKKHCEVKTTLIQDNELIVGNAGSKPRAGIFCPEIIWGWVEKELGTLEKREFDPYFATDETKEVLKKEVFPYWKNKSLEEYVISNLPEETSKITVNSPIIFLGEKLDSGPGQIGSDYQNILKKGFSGIKKEALKKLEQLDPTKRNSSYNFLKAVCICCDGIITLAKRYAHSAKILADMESSYTRKEELLKIANICEWVPAHPARNFHEALQAFWFGQIGLNIEANAPSYSPARFDQYIYPYLKKDLDSGLITMKEAQELLECLWIKLSEVVWLSGEDTARYWAGYMPYQLLTVGGTNSEGEDITNKLSYMCLDASINIRLFQPTISILVGPETPDSLLEKACDLAILGDGHPSFFNNHISTQMLRDKGIPLKLARQCVLVGCSEVNCPSMYQWSSGPWYSIGAMIELALSDGYNHIRKDYYGARTGNPHNFKIYKDFLTAVKRQISHFVHHCSIAGLILEIAHEKFLPLPFSSSFHNDCIEKGKDLTMGGARYNSGPGLTGVGIADAINSIATIKKVIYEDKLVTMDKLLDALEANFKGYEDIRQLLINKSPKYGNDNIYVDSIASGFTDMLVGEIEKHYGKLGYNLRSAIVPTSAGVPFGLEVWALPSGRKAHTPLSDGISPSQGTDRLGPTAVIKSVARLNPSKHRIGTIFNIRFIPQALKGLNGVKNLAALIRTYFSFGGFHVQFNVIDNETLKKAQKNPSDYKNLMVRVAGYSAYFVELAKEVQDDIISRTEHGNI